MGEFSLAHWAIVLVVALLLFGYKKLPDASRSIGQSLRIFKSEMRGMKGDENAATETPASPGAVATPPVDRGRITAATPWTGQPADSPRSTTSPHQ